MAAPELGRIAILDLMKLVFIYGPPSVGKFTTAKILSEMTGYKLFHNHLTVNVVDAIFADDNQVRSLLLQKLRFTMLEAAAQHGRDTIFTLAYSGAVDNEQIKRIVEAVEKYGGEVCFIQLYAPPEELLEHRVENQSRKDMGKISTQARLRQTFAERDVYAAVPFPNNLRIDNTTQSPEEVANQIVEQLKL